MANFSSRDLRALSKPLLTLSIVGAIAAATVAYSGKAVTSAKAEVKSQEAERIEATNRITRSGQERGIIERYIEPYKELERNGIVGEERRIGWIDALRAANQEADLYGGIPGEPAAGLFVQWRGRCGAAHHSSVSHEAAV